jgi:hypothetical protein
MRHLWIAALLAAACGKAWPDVMTEHKPAMDTLRGQLNAVQAVIDQDPAVASYADCTPAAAGADVDFLSYPRLATGGRLVVGKTDLDDVTPSTGFSKALFWTHPHSREYSEETRQKPGLRDGYPQKQPTDADLAVIARALAVKKLVVVRERPGSTVEKGTFDAYLTSLDPPQMLCAHLTRASLVARQQLVVQAKQKLGVSL